MHDSNSHNNLLHHTPEMQRQCKRSDAAGRSSSQLPALRRLNRRSREYPPSQRPPSFSLDQVRKDVDKVIDQSFKARGLEK